MHQRDDEGGDDRKRQDLVGNRDVGEGDDRHPDQVEDRDHDAEAFGPEPVQPTQREFAALIRCQPAGAGQEPPPVLLDDLEAAIGPAVALLLERFIGVGQQAFAVAHIGVVGEPARLLDRKPEIGVLADRVARPAADLVHRGAADQAHRAVHDDGVEFVALDHANVEEAGIFAVHDVVHQRTVAVAMLLRRLHQADAGIGEGRHEILQPVRMHDIVGVDDADDLGINSGAFHRDAQRAGLEALHLLGIDELEAFAELPAVILDRPPELWVGRVVDDADALEIRIVEPRHRIERLLQHLDRLVIGRYVDRDFRERDVLADRGGRKRRALADQPARAAAERHRRDLLDPCHRDQDQRHQQHQTERERERRAPDEIVRRPI